MLAEDVYKAGFNAVVAGAFLVDLFHLDVVGVACQDGVQECPLDGSQGPVSYTHLTLPTTPYV